MGAKGAKLEVPPHFTEEQERLEEVERELQATSHTLGRPNPNPSPSPDSNPNHNPKPKPSPNPNQVANRSTLPNKLASLATVAQWYYGRP